MVGYWFNAVSKEGAAPMPRFTTLECLKATHFQILSEAAHRLLAVRASASPAAKRGGFSRSTFSSGADSNWVFLSPIATPHGTDAFLGSLQSSLKDSASAPSLCKENKSQNNISSEQHDCDNENTLNMSRRNLSPPTSLALVKDVLSQMQPSD
eukprot:Gregarina_sp_Poly_1__641@NODE_1151_length_4930_cov_86_225787_g249_i1_p5_GENE_NODE_1151_length_4930_cov_86_225787_g249_i1NODE_1151_length_4930_cov_86_225787_g249_i1_p5_ORF_typecomplete_len153_score30_32_NODE_1151_length_4930_cov_86_225787_g249_i142574715